MTENAPTPRRSEQLPEDHPLAALGTGPVDCAADVPAAVKDALVDWHAGRGTPLGEDVPEGEVLE